MDLSFNASRLARRRPAGQKPIDALRIGRRPILLSDAITDHLAWMRSVNYAQSTMASRAFYLHAFGAWCQECQVTRLRSITCPLLEQYQEALYLRSLSAERLLSVRSQYHHLHALRMFFRWAARQRLTVHDPAIDLQLPRLPQRLPGNILTHAESEAVLRQPNLLDPLGLRDRAILEVLYSTAIRRAELAHLGIWDLDHAAGTLRVREGKGRKDRVVPISERALAWTDRYVALVRPLVARHSGDDTLFLTKRGQPLAPKPLSTAVAGYIDAARIGKRGSCHLFRHTCATLMLEGGADIRYIQEMLGHASLATTQVYTRVSIRKLKEVHSATHPGARWDPSSLPLTTDRQGAPSRSLGAKLDPGWKRPYLKAVGRHLMDLREARAISRDELARRVGTNRGHIRKLEEGIHPPRPDMVERLSAALAIDPTELVPRQE